MTIFKHYVELTVIKNEEMNNNVLMKIAYEKIHKILAKFNNNQNDAVGISFPNYNQNLGNKMRIFSSQNNLNYFLLKILEDSFFENYCYVTQIEDVPPKHSYEIYERVRKRDYSYLNRIRKNLQKQNVCEEEIEKIINKKKKEFDSKNKTRLPYLILKSMSTKKNFVLEIKRTKVNKENASLFSSFLLSKDKSTVPDF